jgi:hypothetical protein
LMLSSVLASGCVLFERRIVTEPTCVGWTDEQWDAYLDAAIEVRRIEEDGGVAPNDVLVRATGSLLQDCFPHLGW